MSDFGRGEAWRALRQVREQARVDAEKAVVHARAVLAQTQVELAAVRRRVIESQAAGARATDDLSAGALQRAEACRLALAQTTSELAAQLKQARARVDRATAECAHAEQCLRDAVAQERVVERQVERRDMELRRSAQGREDDEAEDRAQRR